MNCYDLDVGNLNPFGIVDLGALPPRAKSSNGAGCRPARRSAGRTIAEPQLACTCADSGKRSIQFLTNTGIYEDSFGGCMRMLTRPDKKNKAAKR